MSQSAGKTTHRILKLESDESTIPLSIDTSKSVRSAVMLSKRVIDKTRHSTERVIVQLHEHLRLLIILWCSGVANRESKFISYS